MFRCRERYAPALTQMPCPQEEAPRAQANRAGFRRAGGALRGRRLAASSRAALLARGLVHQAAGADDLAHRTGSPEGLAPLAGGLGDVPP